MHDRQCSGRTFAPRVRRHRGRCADAGLLALALLAPWAPPFAADAAAQAPETGDLSLEVVEAGTGRSIEGASVRVPALNLQLFTDAAGSVVFRGVPGGRHEVVVEPFGYLSTTVTVGAPRAVPFRVALAPSPVELEGITVETDNVLGLGARRRAIPMQVEVLHAADLLAARQGVAEVLAGRGVALSPCPEEGMRSMAEELERRFCTRFEGRWVYPTLCIDERWLPANPWSLEQYRPDDFHAVEIYTGGAEREVIVLAYTHRFVARALERGQTLSWFVNCAGTPPGAR